MKHEDPQFGEHIKIKKCVSWPKPSKLIVTLKNDPTKRQIIGPNLTCIVARRERPNFGGWGGTIQCGPHTWTRHQTITRVAHSNVDVDPIHTWDKSPLFPLSDPRKRPVRPTLGPLSSHKQQQLLVLSLKEMGHRCCCLIFYHPSCSHGVTYCPK